ncbi:MAG: PAS domain S-box protein [Candidatus Pacebacteria bacterium]|nr:PAS domain S-box protein [Candidatus Paceibacterota bacterium]
MLKIFSRKKSKDLKEKREVFECEEKFRFLYESSGDAIMTLDPSNWRFTSGNPATIKMFEVKDEKEFISLSPWQLSPKFQPDDLLSEKKAKKMIEKAIIEGSNFFEWMHKRYKGENFLANVLLSKVKIDKKQIIQATVRDISKQKEIEERYQTLVNNLSIGIYRNTPGKKGVFLEATPATVSMFEAKSKEEFLKHRVSDIYKDSFEGELFGEKIMRDGFVKNQVLKLVTLKGRDFIGSVTAVKKKDQEGNIYFDGVVEDITKQKKQEKELEKYHKGLEKLVDDRTKELKNTQKALLGMLEDLDIEKTKIKEMKAKDKAILMSIGDGLVVTDKDNKIVMVNKVFEKMLGWKYTEVKGKDIDKVIVRKRENGKKMPTTNYFVCKSKIKFPVSSIATPIKFKNKIIGTVEIFRDITKEKELDHAKSEFISLASHQLRTPLSSMKWLLEMLVEENINLDEKSKQRLDNIYISNERLISLVNELLDINRIETGKLVINKEIVNITDLIKESEKLNEASAKKKNQKIKVSYFTKIKDVNISTLLFSQVIDNILNNAIIFAPENTEINIGIDLEKDNYVVSVHNIGSFIPKSDYKKIFYKFSRGIAAKDSRVMGNGLGLFIAKSAAEANRGKIWVDSDVDKGTTFYFTVPVK